MYVDAKAGQTANGSAKSVRAVLAKINPDSKHSTSRFVNVDEAAEAFDVSRETIRRMAHQGRLPALVMGSGGQAQIRIPRAFVDRVITEVESGRTVVMAEAAAEWTAPRAE
jgi:excisionase family DNA binding protein